MGKQKRPEHASSADLFYNEKESGKYTSNSRMIQIQCEMANRAIELLALPQNESCYVLDLGCGSGLSGECLSDSGHIWLGMDISLPMLDIAIYRQPESDVLLADFGNGVSFRPGTFDAAISISALQWLCYSDNRQFPAHKRLHKFFVTLYSALKRNARAVFQIYPETDAQLEMITKQAMRAGFTGGLVVDFPNSSKAKKIYLCLFAGINSKFTLPKPKLIETQRQKHNHLLNNTSNADISFNNDESSQEDQNSNVEMEEGLSSTSEKNYDNESDHDSVHGMEQDQSLELGSQHAQFSSKPKCILQHKRKNRRKNKAATKGRSWVLKKKETWKLRGKKVARDSKYTGRKRKMKF